MYMLPLYETGFSHEKCMTFLQHGRFTALLLPGF